MLAVVVPSINGKWEVKEVSTPQVGTNVNSQTLRIPS
jgi:hypothetical protein